MELFFAYSAGLLTLINPCVLPILPIVIAGSLQSSPRGPLYMALGMSVTFVVFGLFVNTIGYSIGLDDQRLSQIGAIMMILFGIILLVPKLSSGFSTLTSGFANAGDARLNAMEANGARGQVLTGMLLGVVWSPCIGPTLGGAIALASQGENLLWVTFIMSAFALGVSTIILVLGYGARKSLQHKLRMIAEKSKPLMGAIFLVVGLAIFFRLHHAIEAWALMNLPSWFVDLSVSI